MSARMLCQGGLGQFCSIHQKGVLYYIYKAKAWGPGGVRLAKGP